MNTEYDQDFNVALGKRLSLLRKSRKMSLEHLGIILGVSHQQVHKYETGESTIQPRRIKICAKLFGVPVGYFYGEGESDTHHLKFDKSILTVAAELQQLPFEVRKGLYQLSREINKSFLNMEEQGKAA